MTNHLAFTCRTPPIHRTVKISRHAAVDLLRASPRAGLPTPTHPVQRQLRRLLPDPRLRRAAAALALLVVVFAVTVLVAALTSHRGALLHPDSEHGVAAAISAAALLAAGLAAISTGLWGRGGRQLLPVGALLVIMAVDEWSSLHERVELAAGVEWQVLYLPVFAVAGVFFLLAAHRHRRDRAFLAPWWAGAGCWGVSQVLERAQWLTQTEQRDGYLAMMLTEEVLELAGTLLLLLAVLVLRWGPIVLPRTSTITRR